MSGTSRGNVYYCIIGFFLPTSFLVNPKFSIMSCFFWCQFKWSSFVKVISQFFSEQANGFSVSFMAGSHLKYAIMADFHLLVYMLNECVMYVYALPYFFRLFFYNYNFKFQYYCPMWFTTSHLRLRWRLKFFLLFSYCVMYTDSRHRPQNCIFSILLSVFCFFTCLI